MKLFNNKILMGILMVILVISSVSFCSVVPVSGSAVTPEDKILAFCSDVLQIDLSKYNVTHASHGDHSDYGGAVKLICVALTLKSAKGSVSIAGDFSNNCITRFNIDPIQGEIFFSQLPPTSAVNETRGILERYGVYAAKYRIITADLTSALKMLDKVSDDYLTDRNFFNVGNQRMSAFKMTDITDGQITVTSSGTGIGFAYTVNGEVIHNKSIGFGTSGGCFVFQDSWSLYNTIHESVITNDEAKDMALDLAKDYWQSHYGSVQVDWSKISFAAGVSYVPGERSTPPGFTDTSKSNSPRNPLDLYPYWGIIIYFNQPSINNTVGIQTCIWGDTKEVDYLSTYGYLGSPPYSSNSTFNPQTLTPSDVALNQNDSNQNQMLNSGIFIALAIVGAVAVSTFTAAALRKKRKPPKKL
jgi:hypothetical protein